MQQKYKVQELINQGVDFASIFPENQGIVKEMTGFDFNLVDIVDFVKTQTNNFTKSIPLAEDIDSQIYMIYQKYISGKGEESDEDSSASDVVTSLQMQISDLNDLIEMEDDEVVIERLKTEIKDLEELIEMES